MLQVFWAVKYNAKPGALASMQDPSGQLYIGPAVELTTVQQVTMHPSSIKQGRKALLLVGSKALVTTLQYCQVRLVV